MQRATELIKRAQGKKERKKTNKKERKKHVIEKQLATEGFENTCEDHACFWGLDSMRIYEYRNKFAYISASVQIVYRIVSQCSSVSCAGTAPKASLSA